MSVKVKSAVNGGILEDWDFWKNTSKPDIYKLVFSGEKPPIRT